MIFFIWLHFLVQSSFSPFVYAFSTPLIVLSTDSMDILQRWILKNYVKKNSLLTFDVTLFMCTYARTMTNKKIWSQLYFQFYKNFVLLEFSLQTIVIPLQTNSLKTGISTVFFSVSIYNKMTKTDPNTKENLQKQIKASRQSPRCQKTRKSPKSEDIEHSIAARWLPSCHDGSCLLAKKTEEINLKNIC
jgi:hypothetical protein